MNNYSLWSNAAFSYIIRTISLLIFSLLWSSQNNPEKENLQIAKGFVDGCIVNCIWATVDAIIFYLFGVSPNNIFFAGYIKRNNIRYGTLSLIINGGRMIRASGFNSDPAQLGFMAPIVFLYGMQSNKKTLCILSALAILASASNTALMTTIFIILLNQNKNLKKKSPIGRKSPFYLTGFLLLILIFTLTLGKYASLYKSVILMFKNRLESVYIKSNSNLRVLYILYLPIAIYEILPFFLFGTGFGTASLGYTKNANSLEAIGINNNFPYDMENTYLSYLFDTGIVGLFLFVMIIYVLFNEYRKKDKHSEYYSIIWSFICSSIFSLFFYHYILFGSQMLMLATGLSQLDCDKRNKSKDF